MSWMFIYSIDHLQPGSDNFPFYTREDWGARPSTDLRPISVPVPYVVIHHTYIPGACNTTAECMLSMRSMQAFHQSMDWGDIGYHFCLGSDGSVYEGRGWRNIGIHAGRVNSISIGICLIGDWRAVTPPAAMLASTQELIAAGVKQGILSPTYKLIGHNQVMATECPGTALFNEISTWDHFEQNPTSSYEVYAYPDEQSENEIMTSCIPYVNRAGWHARPPKEVKRLTTPVPFVVIHHSFKPPACYNDEKCSQAMRIMQNYHMDERGWWDIGYNFGVGGNGKAYEGRGWTTIGAQALHFNTVSIGICLIGDWRLTLPPAEQLKTTQKLIALGVSLGYIRKDYKLIGHRQVRDTECPGDALFNEIKTWSHFSPFPHSAADLVHVKELPIAVREQLRENATKTDENVQVVQVT
ncbi:peptidoglycan recognition protein 3-like [Epargyreus clarus]|uniref:peptidoglycan recognition protein 3-like n=1 Tax=Epargyreus clarus TaxID=520877 RepID=UPI003C2BAC31